jgi:hypothetical protein
MYLSTPINDMNEVMTIVKNTININDRASLVQLIISFLFIFYEWILPLFLVENLKCSRQF